MDTTLTLGWGGVGIVNVRLMLQTSVMLRSSMGWGLGYGIGPLGHSKIFFFYGTWWLHL